jgi:uncharacterized damage-inducible protein DinB
MKRLVWIASVYLLAPIAALAQDASTNPLSATLRGTFDRYSKNLVAAAEEMPAEKYGYHPTPEQMTFGKTIAHVSQVNYAACGMISGTPAQTPMKTTDADSKDKLVEGLKASMDYCSQVFTSLNDSKLADTVPSFGGRKVTRLGAVLEVNNDLIDHYAALAVYLRLSGMLPPSAQKKP